ncbi:TonB-dependent receptor [bacterium]|jgi:outer membrane receptor protein involved in Fe transport|nr:TonB-dependent receptor [bacterium]
MLRFKTWIYLVVGGLLMSSLIGEEGEKSSEKKEGELETEKEDVENEVKESVAQKLGRADLISPKKKEEMKLAPALPELVADENVPEPLPGEPEGLPTEPSDLEEVGSGLLPSSAAGDGPGEVEGVVFDSDGNGIPRVIITLPDQGGFQVRTDEEGRFRITGLPASGVSAEFLKSAYVTKVDVMQVKEEGITKVRVSLELKSVELAEGEYLLEGREVILDYEEDEVTGIGLDGTSGPGLAGGGLSKEFLSKSGASDAAGAVGKISGANVVGGKFVVVRGLGDRYNNTTLNGGIVPSPETSRKAVQLDLFPSDALESVSIKKTSSPFLPAEFVGGLVQLQTLKEPKEDFFSVDFSTKYHQPTFTHGKFFTVPGMEVSSDLRPNSPVIDGDPILDSTAFSRPTGSAALAARQRFLHLVKFKPEKMRPEPDQGYGMGFGRSWELGGGNSLNLLGSFTYESKQRYRRTQESNYNSRITSAGTRGELNPLFVNQKTLMIEPDGDRVFAGLDGNYEKDGYTQSREYGLLLGGNLALGDHHDLSATFFNFKSGDSQYSIIDNGLTKASDLDVAEDSLAVGRIESEGFSMNSYRQAYELKYRELQFFQLGGEHRFDDWREGAQLSWNAYSSQTSEESPRSYELKGSYITELGAAVPLEGISIPNIGNLRNPQSSDFIEYVTEDESGEFKLDGILPLFEKTDDRHFNVLLGAGSFQRDRDSRLRSASIKAGSSVNRPDEAIEASDRLLNDREKGTDLNPRRFEGFYAVAAGTQATPKYSGSTTLDTTYIGLDGKWDSWYMLGGFRLEKETRSFDVPGDALGAFTTEVDDVFPSLNFGRTFGAEEEYALRFSYSQSVVRPTFYEYIPARIIDLTNQSLVTGNRNLRESRSENFDINLTWEKENDFIGLNFFYKTIEDPIFTIVDPQLGGRARTFANLGETEVKGIELEASRDLGSGFSLTGNVSYIMATPTPGKVPVGSQEFNVTIDSLEGQPEWLANLILSYEHEDSGVSANLIYNFTGEYLTLASLRNVDDASPGLPNEIRQPFHTLDFNLTKKWETEWADMKVKFAVKNILDSDVEVLYEGGGGVAPASSYSPGREFGISVEGRF